MSDKKKMTATAEALAVSNKVAVYGTLKAGHGNHVLLQEAKPVGRCYAPAGMDMVSLTGFPGVVVRSKPIKHSLVSLEIYEVTERQLTACDLLESNGSFYTREIINTEHGDAWIYLLPESDYGSLPSVQDGSWYPCAEERTFLESGARAVEGVR